MNIICDFVHPTLTHNPPARNPWETVTTHRRAREVIKTRFATTLGRGTLQHYSAHSRTASRKWQVIVRDLQLEFRPTE